MALFSSQVVTVMSREEVAYHFLVAILPQRAQRCLQVLFLSLRARAREQHLVDMSSLPVEQEPKLETLQSLVGVAPQKEAMSTCAVVRLLHSAAQYDLLLAPQARAGLERLI